jgi:hypothetical protein
LRPTRGDIGDVRMIATPDLWPLGPVLPVMRDQEVGVLIAAPGFERLRVWKINMYDMRLAIALRYGDESHLTGRMGRPEVEFEDHGSAAEVVSAGWLVN